MKRRIKLKGIENDVLTGWRKVLCYTQKSRICKYAKTQYQRRFRKHLKNELKGYDG